MLTKERVAKFIEVMKPLKPSIAIILTHLDPDSIACARIFAEICKHLEKNVKIFYAGYLDDPQNKCVWNIFDLVNDFTPIENIKNLNDYDTVLLDSSSPRDNRLGDIEIKPAIIIDHHPNKDKLEESEKSWYWVHTCGAAATMVTKLYMEVGLEFKPSDDLATLAILGLLTDADIKLLSPHMTALDYEVHLHLTKYANMAKAREVFDSILDEKYLELYTTIISKRERRGNIMVSNLGCISREYVGYMARLADAFCAIKGIDTVILWAVSNETLHIKARTIDGKLDLDAFIKERFGCGGARHGKGAAQMPMGFFSPTKNSQKELLEYLTKRILDAIFDPSIA